MTPKPGRRLISLNNQGSEPFMQPNVPPEGKSVITSWRVQVGPGLGPLQRRLVVSHQVGEEEDVRAGESAVETVVAGSNEFASRIPVSEYDHVGLRGPVETLICHKPMNVAGRVAGEWATGERRHFDVLVGIGVPVVLQVGCPTRTATAMATSPRTAAPRLPPSRPPARSSP